MITQDPPRCAQDLLEGAQDLPRSAPDLLEGTLAAFVRFLLSSLFSLFSQLLDPRKCKPWFVFALDNPSVLNPSVLKAKEIRILLRLVRISRPPFLAGRGWKRPWRFGLHLPSRTRFVMSVQRRESQGYMNTNLMWVLISWSR